MIESLDHLDAIMNRLSAEIRTLRDQFDHLRNEVHVTFPRKSGHRVMRFSGPPALE